MARGGLALLRPEQLGQHAATMRTPGLDGQEHQQRLNLFIRKVELTTIECDLHRAKQPDRKLLDAGCIGHVRYKLCHYPIQHRFQPFCYSLEANLIVAKECRRTLARLLSYNREYLHGCLDL